MTGLTAELVVDGRAPQTPALAPNGRLLCYVLAPISRAGDHVDTELRLVDTDGAAASRRATTDTAAESRPRWSADSGTLFFLSDRADRGTPQVHRVTLADGAATAVTSWRAGIVEYDAWTRGARSIFAGSPAEVAERLISVGRLVNADRYALQMDWSGVPHRLVMEAIELPGTEVMPLVDAELGREPGDAL